MKITLINDERVCGNCRNFIQHYYYCNYFKRFDAVNAGHCIKPRIKFKKPLESGCSYWETKEEGE